MTRITTTNEPGKVVDVGPQELKDLEWMGLVGSYVDQVEADEESEQTARNSRKKG